MKHRVMIVDDDPGVGRVVRLLLEEAGHETALSASVAEAKQRLETFAADLVITDLMLPDGTGLDVLEAVKSRGAEVPVIVITAHATVKTAVAAMKGGAFDYLTKPFENDHLQGVVANALRMRDLKNENVRLRSEEEGRYGLSAIIGSSQEMAKVRELVQLAAASDAAVLILGETGTGKELVARAVHLLSARSARPFVAVNCGAIPENLVESELFGHRKGSFTGAVGDRTGRFIQADSGTIFLDEVTEMKRDLQVKLLRAIEAKEVQPVGGTEPIRVDVRIISATNRDPKECVTREKFREDLYYRLNVFSLTIPPLRDHRRDIPELVASYLSRRGFPPDTVGPDTMQLLAEHDFPGNVRELQNVVESGLIMSRGGTVSPEHVVDRLMPVAVARGERPRIPDGGVALAEVEKSYLAEVLRKTDGNQSQAARLLGISRATLLYRMKKHGLG